MAEMPSVRKPIETKPIPLRPPPVETPTVAPEQLPAAVSDSSEAATAPSTDATDNEPALPSLAELDSTTRAALPPLQLSMHVWNPDATRRFAIIDGQRLGEGGKLAGVVVAEIRRDGVVLDIDGRQFLLPRP
jgi:general secretion pathway protein B